MTTRRWSGALAALTVAAGLSVTIAPPAQAATGYARCPADRMCLFTGTGGNGAIGIFATGDVDLSDSTGPTGLDRNTQSVWNRTSCFELWTGTNYNGTAGSSPHGQQGNTVAPYVNSIRSLKKANVC